MKILKKLMKIGGEFKMANLYELTKNYETVLNMLYEEDVDEQMVFVDMNDCLLYIRIN